MTEKAFCRFEKRRRHSTKCCKLPHQQEHRDNRQRVTGERGVSFGFEPPERYVETTGDRKYTNKAYKKHGEADGYAREDQHKQGRERQKPDSKITQVPGSFPFARSRIRKAAMYKPTIAPTTAAAKLGAYPHQTGNCRINVLSPKRIFVSMPL